MYCVDLTCRLVFAMYHICKKKDTIDDVLGSKGTRATKSQYLKLVALGITYLSLWFPLSVVFLVLNISKAPLLHFNWSNVHSDFAKVGFYTVDQLSKTDRAIVEISRWMGPITAFVFFAFFGFSSEVRLEMRACWRKIVYWGKEDDYFPDSFPPRSYALPSNPLPNEYVHATLSGSRGDIENVSNEMRESWSSDVLDTRSIVEKECYI